MVNNIIAQSQNKNILIIGSPRSGTHPMGSMIKKEKNALNYLGEIAMSQCSKTPWRDFDPFLSISARPMLAHAVQLNGKIGILPKIKQLKENSYIVNIRRRDKVKQYASWIYFKSIGAIYHFDHQFQDYVAPKSYCVSYNDIEQFIIEQLIDDQFQADTTLYYEDIDFTKSTIKKNSYAFLPELMIENLDEVKFYLSDWKYPIN